MLEKCHIFIWRADFAGMCSGSLFIVCSGCLVGISPLCSHALTRAQGESCCLLKPACVLAQEVL